MDDFDIIETYNPAEETINFGTRVISSGVDLHEVVTLCTLKCSNEKPVESPNIEHLVYEGRFYLSTEKWFRVFGDINCKTIEFNGKFGGKIDAFCTGGNYILICSRDGAIHLFEKHNSKIVFTSSITKVIEYNEKYFINCFYLPDSEGDTSKFLIVTKQGIVFRLSFNCDSEDKIQFNCEVIAEYHTIVRIVSFTGNILILNGEKCILCDINDTEYDLHCDGLNLKSLYPCDKEQFIGLTHEGELVYVCAVTLLIFPIRTTDKYDNMIFYNGDNKMAFVSCKINGIEYVKLLKFTDFTEVYSIQVSNIISLVYSASEYDEQLFVAKTNSQILCIQMITESVPEKRLERLLKKQQFDEAEKFAITFDLNIEDVKKARVLAFMNEDISELIKMLDEISDVAFKLQVCLDVSCDTLDSIQTVLRYGLNLTQHNSTDGEIEFNAHHLNELMYKFDTFLMLMRFNNSKFNPDDWQEFISADQYKYLLQELQHKNIDSAVAIFMRLDAKRIRNLISTDISIVLSILEKMTVDMYSTFLHSFIPKTIHYLPTFFPQFILWICDRVLHIERNEFHYFPDNAIEFMNKMVRLLSINPYTKINFEEYRINFQKDLEWMSSMAQCLETVQVFKDNFKLFVPLQDCLKGPVSLVQALLCMEGVEVDDKLMDFLVQFLLKSNFKPDLIFINVIQELIAYDEKYWIHVIYPIWKRINSVEDKLNSLKMIMKSANLPWSDVIREMYKHALTLSHKFLVKEIEMDVKMEPIYIVLSKYDLISESVNSLPDMFAVNRVIYLGGIEDAYTLCLNKEMRNRCTLILLNKFILKDNNMISALKIISNVKEDEIMNITHKFFHRTATYLEEEWISLTQKESSVNIAELLLNRCSTVSTDIVQLKNYKEYLQKLKTILLLEKDYKSHFKLVDIKQKQHCNIIEVILLHTVNDYKNKKIGVSEAIGICNKFQSLLSMRDDEILLELCVKMLDVSFLYGAACFLCMNSTNVESMVKIVRIIFDKLKSQKLDYLNHSDSRIDESEDEISENSVTNTNMSQQCIAYCQRISTKALLLEPTQDVNVIFQWSHTFSFLSDYNKNLYKFNHQNNLTMLSQLNIEAVCDTFAMYMKHMTYIHGNITNGKSLLEENKSEDVLLEIERRIPIFLESLCSDGNYTTACQLVICYMNNLSLVGINNAKITRVLNDIFYRQIKFLLEYVFSTNVINIELAFNLLNLYPYEKAVKIVKQALGIYGNVPDKFQTIAELGIKICNYYNMQEEKESFKYIILRGNWWKSISKCNVSQKEFFSTPCNKLPEILIENNLSLQDLQKFCREFEIDAEYYYIDYLRNTLIKWKPDYIVEENVKGIRCLIIHNDEKQLFSKCKEVLNLIKAKDKIYECVNNIWGMLNVYYYEVFLCIIEILTMFKQAKEVEKKKLLLIFLKKYIRSNKPSHNEIEEWYTKFPDTQNIDPISEWRLPFTSTLNGKDIWNILRPEVKLTNFDTWFDVLPILSNLTKDDICSYAVKDMVNSGQLKKCADSEKWGLHLQNSELLDKADSCIQHISNLERATSVAYFLMTHSPKGADQVEAAKLSYKYGKAFKNSPEFQNTPEDQRAFQKLQKKFYSYSSLHILYSNNLAEEKYLNLASQPLELIDALYSDERIIKNAKSMLLNYPDINKTVDEIAQLFKINIQSKRLSLLEKWLNDSCNKSDNNDMDASIFLTPVVNVTNDSEVYLKRACYICHSGDVTFWREHLLSKGMADNQTFPNYYYKARALKCFCAITPIEFVEKLANTTHKDLMNFSDRLLLLHDFKCLGINVNHETVAEYKNRTFLKKISKNAERPLVLKLMASICTYYKIFDMKYWELIINNMIKLKWYQQLKVHLNVLKDNCIIYKEFYINGWQHIIDYSFNSLPDIDDEYFDSMCIENMHLIQSCPVLHQINLKSIFLKCLQLKKAELAALLLQYFSETQKRELLRSLLQNQDVNLLIVSIKKISTSGLVGSHSVIDFINENTTHDT